MAGFEFVRTLFQHAASQGTLSTVMNPMGWLAATVMATMVGAQVGGGPTWLLVGMFALVVLVVVGFLAAFGYFAYVDRHSLRSERFHVTQLAIERSRRGDDVAGIAARFVESPIPSQGQLPAAPPDETAPPAGGPS
jgi:hypothetical protein